MRPNAGRTLIVAALVSSAAAAALAVAPDGSNDELDTRAGAKVFAAGAFTLGGARNPVSCHLLRHVWEHLAPGDS